MEKGRTHLSPLPTVSFERRLPLPDSQVGIFESLRTLYVRDLLIRICESWLLRHTCRKHACGEELTTSRRNNRLFVVRVGLAVSMRWRRRRRLHGRGGERLHCRKVRKCLIGICMAFASIVAAWFPRGAGWYDGWFHFILELAVHTSHVILGPDGRKSCEELKHKPPS